MSVRDMLMAAAGVDTGGGSDDNFKNVTLLLNGDGTNGGQNNTFLDSSTNAFTITRNGNTTQGSFSPYGSNWGVYFNGSTDYFGYGEQATWAFNTGNFTIEGWFNWSSNTGSQTLFSSKGYPSTSNGSFMVRRTNSSEIMVDFYVSGGEVAFYFEANTNVGIWYHVALVRNSGVTSLYLNGVSCSGGGSGISGKNVNDLSASGLYIGKDNYNNSINGYISNFRITNNAVYTSSFTPSTTPLTAISGTSLLTCQSNKFIDNSGYSYIAQIYGAPSVQRFSPFNPTASYDTATIGGSGYFDGSGDYLVTGTSSAFAFGTGNFTVECWIYRTANTGNWSYWFNNLSSGGAGDTEWTISLDPSNNPAFGSYNTTYITTSTAIKLNSWNHIAVSRSGSTLSLFLNGVRTGTVSNSNNFSATNGANIGAYGSGSTAINAYITDCRVVKGTAVYDPTSSTCTVPTAPLTSVSGTSLLCKMTNAGIPDSAMMNDLETVGNAQVSTSVKKFGTGSISFDGTGDYLVTISKPITETGTGDFTIEGWAYIEAFGDPRPIFCLGDSDLSSGLELYVNTSSAALIRSGGTTRVNGGTNSLTSGSWKHFAVVRNSGSVYLYVDGVAKGTAWASTTNFTGNMYIGCDFQTAVTYMFYGYIDDFRFTKGLARYTANFTPPTAALPVK